MESGRTLQIRGMSCAACVARVEGALKAVPGVESCAVNLTTGLARVETTAPDDQLVAAVERAGYAAIALAAGASAQTLRSIAAEQQIHVRQVRRRLIVGAVAAAPVLVLDLVHLSPAPWLLLAEWLLATLVVVYTGGPFFLGAARALRRSTANMDVLVALGAGTAYVYSAVLTSLQLIHHTHGGLHTEYHAALAIIVLVTLGKYLEARAKRAANTAVAALAKEAASTALRVRDDGSVETVPAEALAVGDRVQVLAHQAVPVDGVLLEGSGALDVSVLTGESVPQELSAGAVDAPPAKIPAGARLLDGRIVLRATATAAESTVARILALVQNAQAGKMQIQGLADRVAAVFVPIVLALAILSLVIWLAVPFTLTGGYIDTEHLATAIVTSIAVIVIACPCAMGLATPTALTVALGRAARMGILFTNAAALETAGRSNQPATVSNRTATVRERPVNAAPTTTAPAQSRRGSGIAVVLFDKTGTLTRGEFDVVRVETLAPVNVVAVAAALEQFSEHPLARAITTHAAREKITLPEPDAFSSVPGGGLRGDLGGRSYALGSLTFLASLGVEAAAHQPLIESLHAEGLTLVALAEMNAPPRLVGLLALRDALRADTRDTLAALRAAGYRVGVLSGDTAAAVRGTLAHAPLDICLANVRPEEKAARIAELQRDVGGVAFVGDGINDGPALATADLGIAMGAGSTELARASGDVILLAPHLRAIPETLALARRTLRIIKQNLFWAFGYNVAAIPLAMAGLLPPAVAAAAMILSSLSVVGNALRLNGTANREPPRIGDRQSSVCSPSGGQGSGA